MLYKSLYRLINLYLPDISKIMLLINSIILKEILNKYNTTELKIKKLKYLFKLIFVYYYFSKKTTKNIENKVNINNIYITDKVTDHKLKIYQKNRLEEEILNKIDFNN